MSMRSSGLLALNSDNEILGYEVIVSSKDNFPDTEDLIIYIQDSTKDFILEHLPCDNLVFVIEGLAFAANSGHKDVLAGIYWGVRTAIWKEWPFIKIGSVPVTSWRSKVLNKEDRAYAKANFTPKADAIKIATVNKLPADVNKLFLDYIELMQYNKKAIYDLTDAYFLCKYRNSLETS